MATEHPEPAAPAGSTRATRSVVRHMTPEMKREFAGHVTRMVGLHVNMLETAAAKLKADDADESACQCAVDLINAICNCAGTALGEILSDLGL